MDHRPHFSSGTENRKETCHTCMFIWLIQWVNRYISCPEDVNEYPWISFSPFIVAICIEFTLYRDSYLPSNAPMS